jgi:hypothetical protein
MKDDRFVVVGDGIVKDNQTNLLWQRSDDGKQRNWDEAIDYARELLLNRHCNWRLPTMEELSALIDFAKNKPCIDPIFKCRNGGYWSSSVDVSGGVWAVNLYRGQVGVGNKIQLGYVRCVKGTEKERTWKE